MVVVLENREYGQVIGSRSAPYVNELTDRFGLATRAYATTHPSLPNYLALIAGTTFGITSDCTSCSVEGTTLVDQLEGRGVAWKAYVEGFPTPCYSGASAPNGYAKKHNPFAYVRHLARDRARCAHVVASRELDADLAAGRAPPFVWVTPNLCHDGHDCPTASMDTWLATNIESVLRSSWYRDGGIVIVTWDEGTTNASCCREARGGHIPTILVSARTPARARLDRPVDQAGILRTIEALYRLPHLGAADCSCSGDLLPLVQLASPS